MLPDNAAHIFAIGARFTAKAGCVSGQANGKLRGIESFIAIEVRDRDFGGRDQPEILFAVRDAEQILRKFRQLARTVHGLRIHQVRRQNFGVAMLARVQIEHEICKSALESRSQRPIDGKAGSGKLGRAFEIEHAKMLAQFPMRLGLEIERRWRTPAARFDVVRFALPYRHSVMGKIGKSCQDVAQAGVGIGGLFFELLNLLAHILGGLNLRGGILPAFLGPGDLFGSLVPPGFQSLHLGDGVAAFGIDRLEILQRFCRIHAALAQLFLDQGEVVANEV